MSGKAMSGEKEPIAARIVLRAVIPVMKVVVEDDPAMKKRFAGTNATVQFRAKNAGETIGAFLVFENGALRVEQGICDNPDITFGFGSPEKLVAMFSGKPVIPRIRGFLRMGLLIKVFRLLLRMKLMMPDARPTDPADRRLKVKMGFYMVTTALSQYNKGGDPEMVKWTSKQPERIYQISVEPEGIAAYLRIKAGKSKAGRGVYKKRRPFVHMKFNGVDGAFPVVMNEVDLVSAMREGHLAVEGSPEYARDFGNFMMRIQALLL